jgi:hypothetical protein
MPQLRDVSNSRHDACCLRQKYDYSVGFGRCQALAMIVLAAFSYLGMV